MRVVLNDFYRNKVSLPREVRTASTLVDALAMWREKRLLNIVKSCAGTDDQFRINFSTIHQEYADEVKFILLSKGKEREMCMLLLENIKNRFKMGCLACVPGWIKGAAGECGAELEKILESNNVIIQNSPND